MKQDKKLSMALVIGIVVIVFLLSRQYFFRLDLTEDKEFTMSKATKNILHNLDDQVNVKAYFSENLPADFERVKTDFQNLLIEYNNISKGKVDYHFINPGKDQASEQEATQNGIQPLLINVREKDEASQKKAFMGAIVEYGDQKEVIPFINRESPMEYDLTTAIKKISVKDKPSLGFLQGNGEPALNQMPQVTKELSVIYSVESIDLAKEETIADRIKAIVIVNPADSIPDEQFKKLDDYLAKGGKIIAAVNAVSGDFSTASGSEVKNNIFKWLASHGVTVDPTFVVDASCGKVTLQQRIGNFSIPTQINFPYLPLIKTFSKHPVTTGIEAVLFQFASPIHFKSADGALFTALLTSSTKAGTLNVPLYFDVQKQWTQADFPLSNIPLGGVVEGLMQNPDSRLVVYSDGDFIISQEGNLNPDNVNLMLNTVEWLVDKSGLAELRDKGIVYRPIKDLEEGKRAFTKYFNFLFPLALVGAVGIWRSQRNRRKRHQRMEEKYV
jgi:gliding-associated putative ABC transporter substrate-binding component GldG